jgi:hypothetical protein
LTRKLSKSLYVFRAPTVEPAGSPVAVNVTVSVKRAEGEGLN